jgi:hypothetical protein
VDRPKLAKELDRQARKRGRRLSVLLQVNVGEEATKSGCSIEEASSLLEKTASLEALTVRGLMTLPPYLEDAEAVRPYFQELRRLMERLRRDAPHPGVFDQLSMGMSHDFEVAIEEGATMVRVGTDLFGRRPR